MQVRPLKRLEIVTQLTEKYTTNKNGSRIKEWQAQQWPMHFDHASILVQNTIFKKLELQILTILSRSCSCQS